MAGNRFLFTVNQLQNTPGEISLSIKTENLTPLFEIANSYGSFHLTRTLSGYILDVGKYKFAIHDQIDLCKLGLIGVARLDLESAALLCKIGLLLFSDQPERIKLVARNREELQLLWEQAQQFALQVMPADKAQQSLYSKWEQAKSTPEAKPAQATHNFLFSLLQKPEKSLDTAVNFLFTERSGEEANQEVALYIEVGRFNQLLEMLEAYGSLHLSLGPQGWLLDVGQYKFTVTDHVNLLKLSLLNISRLSLGAAELVAKIARMVLHNDTHAAQLDVNTPSEDIDAQLTEKTLSKAELERLVTTNQRLQETQMLWQKCTERNIKLQAANNLQKQLFTQWQQEYSALQTQRQSQTTFQRNPPPNHGDNASFGPGKS